MVSNKSAAATAKKPAGKSIASVKKLLASKKTPNEVIGSFSKPVSSSNVRKGSKRVKFMRNLRKQAKLQDIIYQEELKEPKDRDKDNKDPFHCFSKATVARLVRYHTGEGEDKKYVSRNYLRYFHLILESLLTMDVRNASRVSGEKRKVTTTLGDFNLVVKHPGYRI
jgi:hypothetical protein